MLTPDMSSSWSAAGRPLARAELARDWSTFSYSRFCITASDTCRSGEGRGGGDTELRSGDTGARSSDTGVRSGPTPLFSAETAKNETPTLLTLTCCCFDFGEPANTMPLATCSASPCRYVEEVKGDKTQRLGASFLRRMQDVCTSSMNVITSSKCAVRK